MSFREEKNHQPAIMGNFLVRKTQKICVVSSALAHQDTDREIQFKKVTAGYDQTLYYLLAFSQIHPQQDVIIKTEAKPRKNKELPPLCNN